MKKLPAAVSLLRVAGTFGGPVGMAVGVPACRRPEEVTLPKVLALPFGRQRPSWQFPGNGEPAPHPSVGPPEYLLA